MSLWRAGGRQWEAGSQQGCLWFLGIRLTSEFVSGQPQAAESKVSPQAGLYDQFLAH